MGVSENNNQGMCVHVQQSVLQKKNRMKNKD